MDAWIRVVDRVIKGACQRSIDSFYLAWVDDGVNGEETRATLKARVVGDGNKQTKHNNQYIIIQCVVRLHKTITMYTKNRIQWMKNQCI